VLLDRETSDFTPFPTIAILKIRARPVDAKEFVLDQDAQIADRSSRDA
jgi:hypothetical protein